MDADIVDTIDSLPIPRRIAAMKEKTLAAKRILSTEQARIITETYASHAGEPRSLLRARAFAESARKIRIAIEPGELVVGNRTVELRAGVVFPESGIAWILRELDTIPTREQDPFLVRPDDARYIRDTLAPFWKHKTLEEAIQTRIGDDVAQVKKVIKINQTDHAQGHVIPNVKSWLALGPAGLLEKAESRLRTASDRDSRLFYEGIQIVLEGARGFIRRYGELAFSMAHTEVATAAVQSSPYRDELRQYSLICQKLADNPPSSFREAVQSLWFLFVLLQLESNASSFSPGRLDQYLWPYLDHDLRTGRLDIEQALEILECLWIKFNHIVYMRNSEGATYFAGFPIGFNIAIGGTSQNGTDAVNPLSYLCLRAQEHIGLPQPNLSARLHARSPDRFLLTVSRVIGAGSGMPQVFNDTSIVPALMKVGVAEADARDYGVVGCVELSPQGNNLGWSDAAMFNLVKLLELTLNDGRCLLTGARIGPSTGTLAAYPTFAALETALENQLDHYVDLMIRFCDIVDRLHAVWMPSPFLSAVVDDCLDKALDVTAGGAHYNLSGIQGIQIANLADSLAVIRQGVYEQENVDPTELLEALSHDWHGYERLRQFALNKFPKYGNDVEEVDAVGRKWAQLFAEKLSRYTNARGGPYHAGFYTVSAHVPMGKNVGATPDGRKAGMPLADGGLSPMAGRDRHGPTAMLKSVARIDSTMGSNGTLLNAKFLPDLFRTRGGLLKFAALLKAFVTLGIHHIQFNVLNDADLREAMQDPERFRGLTVRVAGYTAYFTELAEPIQSEIIRRTSYGA